MVRDKDFAMRQLLALIVVLGTVAGPAFAQEKVVRLDYGFSYVIPRDYRPSPAERRNVLGEDLIALEIKRGTQTQTLSESATGATNLSILSSIRLVALPASQTIRTGGDDKPADGEAPAIDEDSARRVVEGLNSVMRLSGTTLDYQKSAMIKVSGYDAAAILCTGFSQRLNESFTIRLIFLPRKGKMYLFLFGSLNSEFEEKVGAFNAFMKSFQFLTPPGAKPTPKNTAKKPVGKKK
jgi:hypothetical protein